MKQSRTLELDGKTLRLVWRPFFPSCKPCAFWPDEYVDCPKDEDGLLRCTCGIWRETLASRIRRARAERAKRPRRIENGRTLVQCLSLREIKRAEIRGLLERSSDGRAWRETFFSRFCRAYASEVAREDHDAQ
jgi:hypothetical protein